MALSIICPIQSLMLHCQSFLCITIICAYNNHLSMPIVFVTHANRLCITIWQSFECQSFKHCNHWSCTFNHLWISPHQVYHSTFQTAYSKTVCNIFISHINLRFKLFCVAESCKYMRDCANCDVLLRIYYSLRFVNFMF